MPPPLASRLSRQIALTVFLVVAAASLAVLLALAPACDWPTATGTGTGGATTADAGVACSVTSRSSTGLNCLDILHPPEGEGVQPQSSRTAL